MISGFSNRRMDRYLVVFDPVTKKFEVVEEYDLQSSDVPMTEASTDFALIVELKKAFEYASLYLDVVEVFRRDRIKEDLLADAIK